MITSYSLERFKTLRWNTSDCNETRRHLFTPVRLCHKMLVLLQISNWSLLADHWFIKTISRRFISQETEQKWLVLTLGAKTLDVPKILSIVSQWSWRLTAFLLDICPQWRYQNTSLLYIMPLCVRYYILFFCISGFNLRYQIWNKVGLSCRPCQNCWVIKLNILDLFILLIYIFSKKRYKSY